MVNKKKKKKMTYRKVTTTIMAWSNSNWRWIGDKRFNLQ